MAFFSDLIQHIAVLSEVCGAEVTSAQLADAVARLTGDDAIRVIEEASALVRAGESLRIAASGVVAAQSTREHGHSGVAQTRGHRSPISLVQELMGTTKADAAKHVRLGESLLAGVAAAGSPAGEAEAGVDEPTCPPWHAPLGRALLAGSITSAQHDVILRGLGEPPAAETDDLAATIAEAWSVAAEQLIAEAAERTVEVLARTARAVGDVLDPEGAARRFDERFERRSFRMWTDADGARRGSFAFDDLGGAWMQTIVDSALRPRRGGPRFVDPDEKARAQELADDSRTNEQLAYDLMMDVLRAGALADAETVFGTWQAGVRVVITAEAVDAAQRGIAAVGLVEDDQTTLPAWLVAEQCCDTGTAEFTLDQDGNPLYAGRAQRLFNSRQRVALAIRDGGCRWRGCDRPASYCEAHHIDDYAEGGRTDVDRGILLCRFHHMQLHHGGWRITRDGLGEFLLHPPGDGEPIVLVRRLALRYAWGDIDPPPRRFRPAA